MATVLLSGITLSCTPGAQFNTLVEYKLSSDVGWTSAGNHLTNTNGTFVTPFTITGLDEGECYDFRFTPGIATACPLTTQFCLEPSPIWIALAQACETEGGFGVVKTITGLSSPVITWWDDEQEFLYVMDTDDPAGNVYWFEDISTATTVADATHSATVTFDPLWGYAIDEVNRRLLMVGDNTNGLVVYDVDTDTVSTVAYGSNGAFFRTSLYIFDTQIIVNDFLTNIVIIDRDTLVITDTIPIAGLTNPEHFDNGPWLMVQANNGSLYTVSNNGDSASVGVYDTSFNHITEIVLPGVLTWTFGNYWQFIYYDVTSDKIYVSDTGSNQRFVIDPDTNTVVDQRTYTNTEDRTNATFIFSVDPLTDTLYAKYSGRNDSSDLGRSRVYRVNRNTYDFEVMYENAAYQNLEGIPSLGWLVGSDPGGLNAGGTEDFDTDGTITVLSNSVGGTNTGNVITLTLQEVLMPGNTPTGGVKDNVPSDPDYIAPFMDTTACPVTFSLACPSDAVVTFHDADDTVDYEFSIANAVRFNPAIDNIIVYWRLNGTRQTSILISDPTVSNYYTDTFTGVVTGGGDVVDIEVVYRDAANVQLAFCILS